MVYEKKFPDGDTAKTCVRDGFSANGDVTCKGCFEKKLELDKLREKIKSLQATLRYREKRGKEKPFGENTPSSSTLKSNSSTENRNKQGGATEGHTGHGRTKISGNLNVSDSSGDEEVTCITSEAQDIDCCPQCDLSLNLVDIRTRSILDIHPIAAFKTLFSIQRSECPGCGERFKSSIPALPKFQFSNRLIAQAAVLYYLHGVPLKKITRIFGDDVNSGALHGAFDKISELCLPAKKLLIEDYRKTKVKHADETGWRTDGQSGYAWYFGTNKTSIFEFRDSRSGKIAKEILGATTLNGYLVVDRYAGYNKIDCEIQYCYAHLLRDVKGLAKEFPDSNEIKIFSNEFGKCLALAMKLKKKNISDEEYYSEALKLKEKIVGIVNSSASHLGIRRIQEIFIQCEPRLYHWVVDRDVPAHNNFAEREIRPTTIARKVSFGSQSTAGAFRRSNIMTVLHTARKRLSRNEDVAIWFERKLNEISAGSDPAILRVNPQ